MRMQHYLHLRVKLNMHLIHQYRRKEGQSFHLSVIKLNWKW